MGSIICFTYIYCNKILLQMVYLNANFAVQSLQKRNVQSVTIKYCVHPVTTCTTDIQSENCTLERYKKNNIKFHRHTNSLQLFNVRWLNCHNRMWSHRFHQRARCLYRYLHHGRIRRALWQLVLIRGERNRYATV